MLVAIVVSFVVGLVVGAVGLVALALRDDRKHAIELDRVARED